MQSTFVESICIVMDLYARISGRSGLNGIVVVERIIVLCSPPDMHEFLVGVLDMCIETRDLGQS